MNLGQIRNAILNNSVSHTVLRNLPDLVVHGYPGYHIHRLHKLFRDGNSEVLEHQLENALASMLKCALKNVPHYRETIPIHPGDVTANNARKALSEFPLLHKSTVMLNPRRFVNDKIPNWRLTHGTSGGSTGQGMAIYGGYRIGIIEQAFFNHHWGPLGFHHRKSRIVRFATMGRSTKDEDPCRRVGNLLLISPYHLNDRWLPHIVKSIQAFRPAVLWSYPSCARDLAIFLQSSGAVLPSITGVCLSSEMCLFTDYELIKCSMNCPVSVNYGLSERTNIAFSRLSNDQNSLLYDLDPVYGVTETNQVDKDLLELVGTSYWNHTMPLIRYCTQDLVKMSGNTITHLDGRTQEVLIGRNGERIPGFSIKIDAYTWKHIDTYQVLQSEKGKLLIQVVPRKTLPHDFMQRLSSSQQERLGDMFTIKVVSVKQVAKSASGKQQLILSTLKG